jgi:hypothetical protein
LVGTLQHQEAVVVEEKVLVEEVAQGMHVDTVELLYLEDKQHFTKVNVLRSFS